MSRTPTKRRGPMGGHGGMGMSVEKAKDFKGTMKTLWSYLSNYKFAIILVAVFAIGSTIFSIVGPKILGNATTELFNGLMDKLQGGSGINFGKIGEILLFLIGLYVVSASFSFIQGFIMTNVSQKLTYRLRKNISEKIGRKPEPEHHPAYYQRHHAGRNSSDDVLHQLDYDSGIPADSAHFFGNHHQDH